MQTHSRAIVSLLIILLVTSGTAFAGTISLAWDPVPDSDLDGYHVYYGTSAGNYGPPQQVDSSTTETTLSGLDACTLWHVAVKAYDTGGAESANYSTEIVGLPRPVVSSASPASAQQGSSATMTISGESFDAGATVEVSGAGVSVASVQQVTCTSLSVTLDIAANAPLGARDITIVNPDNTFGARTDAFSVVNAPPSVTATTPADGASGVSEGIAPAVTFSEAMDPASITAGNVQLLDAGGQPVAQAPGSPSLSGNGLTATVSPASDLGWESTYRVRVAGGSGGVLDAAGGAMASDYQQATGFTTVVEPDLSGPSVTSTNPADGATDVALGTQPSVTFDEAVDGASVSASSVQLLDAGGQPVAQASGSPQLSPNGRTVTIVPAAVLDENATYRIRVSGVTDQTGNAISPSYQQATGFTAENLPPGDVAGARRTDVR